MELRGQVMAFILISTVGPLAVALALKLLLSQALQGRLPRVEAAVDRWWTWAPLVALIAGAWVIVGVLPALAMLIAALVLIQVSDERLDAPFRFVHRRSQR